MSIRGIDKSITIEGGSQPAFHTVEKGDTLKSIAKLYSVTSDAVLKLNPHIKDQMKLKEGLAIHLPGASEKSLGHTQKLLTKDIFEHSRKLPGDALAMKHPGDALAMKYAPARKMIGDALAMKLPGDALAMKYAPAHKMIGDALAMKYAPAHKPIGDALAMKHLGQAKVGRSQMRKIDPGKAQPFQTFDSKSFDVGKLKK